MSTLSSLENSIKTFLYEKNFVQEELDLFRELSEKYDIPYLEFLQSATEEKKERLLTEEPVLAMAAATFSLTALYLIYAKIREKHALKRAGCNKIPRKQRVDCFRTAKINEVQDKIRAVRQLMSKAKDPKSKKRGEKEIKKLEKRLIQIKNWAGRTPLYKM